MPIVKAGKFLVCVAIFLANTERYAFLCGSGTYLSLCVVITITFADSAYHSDKAMNLQSAGNSSSRRRHWPLSSSATPVFHRSRRQACVV